MTTTDTPRTMHATLNDNDAAALYQVYCDSVGGKAYDGKPLPDWDAFSSDPTKEKQSQAWRDVAHFAFYASEREKSQKLEAEVERLGGLLYETRSLLTEFYDCVDIGGLHDGDCNISTEDPEKWEQGCNCTTAELRRKYIRLYSK